MISIITELTKWKDLYAHGKLDIGSKLKIDKYVDKYREHPIYDDPNKKPYTMKEFWGEN